MTNRKEPTSPKYILIQNEFTLSYTEDDCLINDKVIENKTETKLSAKEYCYEKQKSFYDTFLKRHFKNVVVLTAAGTSLDNGGETSGKTRVGLWEFCKTEIDAFEYSIADFKTKPFYINKDIEGLLSHLILFEKLNGEIKNGEVVLRETLESKIAEACKLKLQPQAPIRTF